MSINVKFQVLKTEYKALLVEGRGNVPTVSAHIVFISCRLYTFAVSAKYWCSSCTTWDNRKCYLVRRTKELYAITSQTMLFPGPGRPLFHSFASAPATKECFTVPRKNHEAERHRLQGSNSRAVPGDQARA